MRDLYRSEYRKVAGNRYLVGCTVWVYPIIALLMCSLLFFFFALSPDTREGYIELDFGWTTYFLFSWFLPMEQLGIWRLPMIGFIAAIFAGEYQYGTWKNILPPNRRWQMLLTKMLAVVGLIAFALLAMSLILVFGMGLSHALFDMPYPPALDEIDLGQTVKIFSLQMVLTLYLILLWSLIATIFATASCSLIFTVVGTLIFSFVESLGIRLPVELAVNWLGLDWFAYFYLIMPTHSLNNVLTWVALDDPFTIFGKNVSLATSLIVLAVWGLGLGSLAFWSFQRQDIQ